MSESMSEFIERVNKLEERYKGDPIDRYTPFWMMPKELLKKVRDELTAPSLFDATTTPGERRDRPHAREVNKPTR